jgi:hypothetical protein
VDEDWFQETKTDLFQNNFLPGRKIPDFDLSSIEGIFRETDCAPRIKGFTLDHTNTSPWITAIYISQYHAEKASKALPSFGLNVYYPKCRFKEKEVLADWEMKSVRREKQGQVKQRFVAAYGRYLFIQLPEDQDTFENVEISEEFLSGRMDENGLANIMFADGTYSLTLHREIVQNQEFHERQNKATDPKVMLRFNEGEQVQVIDGNLAGKIVRMACNVFMSFKLKSKVEVILGKSGARHYVKVGYLKKI